MHLLNFKNVVCSCDFIIEVLKPSEIYSRLGRENKMSIPFTPNYNTTKRVPVHPLRGMSILLLNLED